MSPQLRGPSKKDFLALVDPTRENLLLYKASTTDNISWTESRECALYFGTSRIACAKDITSHL